MINDCSTPSQKMLAMKAVLKDPIFSAKSSHTDIINMEKESPTVVDLLMTLKLVRKIDVD